MNRRAFLASLPFLPAVAKAALAKPVAIINPAWVAAGPKCDFEIVSIGGGGGGGSNFSPAIPAANGALGLDKYPLRYNADGS